MNENRELNTDSGDINFDDQIESNKKYIVDRIKSIKETTAEMNSGLRYWVYRLIDILFLPYLKPKDFLSLRPPLGLLSISMHLFLLFMILTLLSIILS